MNRHFVWALAGILVMAGAMSAGAITIDGDFSDWTGVPVDYDDHVYNPAVDGNMSPDSTFDFMFRGLGTADYGLSGPFSDELPGVEDELDVDLVKYSLEKGVSGTWADGMVFFHVKLAGGRVLDTTDTGTAPPSAMSATSPYGPVYEQSFYDIFIDVDPGAGTGFNNDFTGAGYPHFDPLDGADYLIELTDTYVPGYGVFQLYQYSGSGGDWVWTWVAEIQGAASPNLGGYEAALPLALIGVVPDCGGGFGYAMVTSDSEDFFGDDLVPGYLGGVGLLMGVTDPALSTPMRYLSIPFDDPELCEVNADPRTQGYWWRQATSLDLIPGYDGKVKQIHPDWTYEELLALFLATDADLAFSGQTTAEALWAEEKTKLEKSLKQYAALMLNVNSGLLTPVVEVDLTEFGYGMMSVGDVVVLLRDLWLDGKYNKVNNIADAINTGAAIP